MERESLTCNLATRLPDLLSADRGGTRGYIHEGMQAQGREESVLFLPFSGGDFQGLDMLSLILSPGQLLPVPWYPGPTVGGR